MSTIKGLRKLMICDQACRHNQRLHCNPDQMSGLPVHTEYGLISDQNIECSAVAYASDQTYGPGKSTDTPSPGCYLEKSEGSSLSVARFKFHISSVVSSQRDKSRWEKPWERRESRERRRQCIL